MSAPRTVDWHDQQILTPLDLERLPGEWWEVHVTTEGVDLERELARELPSGHVLTGVTAQAVAVRRHLKEVIFWLPDRSNWALVHLTHRAETDPHWPSTFVADSWNTLVEALTAD